MLTQKKFNEIYKYSDGQLFWVNPYHKSKVAGGVDSNGYHRVSWRGKQYSTHRVVFLMHHGWLPKMIDHIDGNPLNNRIDNLRPCNHKQNATNRKASPKSKSGIKGVSWHESAKRWQVCVGVGGKVKYIGIYGDIYDAEKAAIKARNLYHDNDFVCHGRRL